MGWLSFLWKCFHYHANTSLKRRPKGLQRGLFIQVTKKQGFQPLLKSVYYTSHPSYTNNFLKIFKTERDFLAHQVLSPAVMTLPKKIQIYIHTPVQVVLTFLMITLYCQATPHFPSSLSQLLSFHSTFPHCQIHVYLFSALPFFFIQFSHSSILQDT